MIKLYIFPEAFGLRNVSPFCLKAEMALVHLGLDYEIIIEGDPRKAPMAKLPYINDGGQVIADSEIIFPHLDKRTNGGLFKDLSPSELSIGIAMTRLVEDHLYWLMVASRWLDDDWFPNVRDGFFGSMPGPMTNLVGFIARRQVSKTIELQGLGKHTLEQQKVFARRDLEAINNIVAVENYIVGKRLTVFDFTTASLVSGVLDHRPATWMNAIIDEFPALKEYADRVQSEVGVYGRILS